MISKKITFVLLLFALSPVFGQEQDKKETNNFSNRIMLDVGMGHWVSDRFRTAVLGKDFGFGITVNPGLSFLQLQARYDFSTIRTAAGDTLFTTYDDTRIDFTTLQFAVCKQMKVRNQTIILAFSPAGITMINIEDRLITFGVSGGFNANYLFRIPGNLAMFKHLEVGISLSILSRTYNITDEKAEFKEWFSSNKEILDRDINVIFGVSISI